MSAVLLDTHALVWWVDDPSRLTRAQRRTATRASDDRRLWASDISLWEVALLVERRRIELSSPLDVWLENAVAEPAIRRCALSPTIVKAMTDLASTRGWDPADRFIVATARVLGARLVTTDERIIESELVETVC